MQLLNVVCVSEMWHAFVECGMRLWNVACLCGVAFSNVYFNLLNNLLLLYFDVFMPVNSEQCNFYDILKPLFLLPKPSMEYLKKHYY